MGMQLVYDGVDLAGLADEFRILGVSTVREPADAPQRERVTYRVRLDFFQQTYADNRALIEQVRGALTTQQVQMVWTDESGEVRLQRTVTVANDEEAEEAAQRGGTYWQGLTLSFWFYNHDVAANCMSGTVAGKDLGAVERWTEEVQVSRFDELRDVRRRVAVQVTASGRWQCDTTQDLDTRRAALLTQAADLEAALVLNASVTVAFASFNQKVRISNAKVDVDQPHWSIAWSFTAVYTAYPNELNYLLCNFKVALREAKLEAVRYWSLTGKIDSVTEADARDKLALLKASLLPAGLRRGMRTQTCGTSKAGRKGTKDASDTRGWGDGDRTQLHARLPRDGRDGGDLSAVQAGRGQAELRHGGPFR